MCGIFGISGCEGAARHAAHGLYGLQHRGQESAGIAVWDGARIRVAKDMGLVSEVFAGSDFSELPGRSAIGHVRYSTSGDSDVRNAHPILAATQHGDIALGHNGNLVNGIELRGALEREGAIFSSTTDSEVILHLLARSHAKRPEDALAESLLQLKGAFSLVLLLGETLVGVRDPWGFRPLVLGELDGSAVLSSEACALDLLRAKFVREIEPGEVVVCRGGVVESFRPFPAATPVPCIFEQVYFARPDSHQFGVSVFGARVAMGRVLAQEQPAEADCVVPIPDSGVPAAQGFSEGSGLPLVHGFVRNHYIGRTFIAPLQSVRDLSVRIKLNAMPSQLAGRRVVLIDDSLVRGTTAKKIVKIVREAGAREVHLRLSSPPVVNPCLYGIDTPERSELLAANHELEAIRRFVEADSLGYLSAEGMAQACGRSLSGFCHACFGGTYPVPPPTPGLCQARLFEKERR